MLEPVRRLPAYDPDFVKTWLRDTMHVSNPDQISAVLSHYQNWYDQRQHQCAIADTQEPGRAHVVMIWQENPDGQYILAVTKGMPEVHLRYQKIWATDKPQRTALEWGDAVVSGSLYGVPGDTVYDIDLSKIQDIRDSSQDLIAEELVKTVLSQMTSGDKNYTYLEDYYPSTFDERTSKIDILKRHAMRVEHARMNEAFRKFLRALDPNVLAIMHRARYYDADFYTWLEGRMPVGQAYSQKNSLYVVPPESRKYRQAALTALPSLIWPVSDPQDSFATHFSRVVDAGGDLASALEAGLLSRNGTHTKISKEMMRWLWGRGWRSFVPKGDAPDGITNILPVLNALPREWRPSNGKETDTLFLASNNIDMIWWAIAGQLRGSPSAHEMLVAFMRAANNPHSLPKSFFTIDGKPQKVSKNLYDNLSVINEAT